jgi:hypothetical protein
MKILPLKCADVTRNDPITIILAEKLTVRKAVNPESNLK